MEQIVRHLEAAVLILTGVGALKDRLYGAYIQHLESLDLNAGGGELPRKLSAAEAERYAALIVRVFSTVSGVRSLARNVPPRRVVSPLAAILQLEPVTAEARSG